MALSEKHLCWNLLHDYLISHQLENLILVGDLNLTLSAEEEKGGNRVQNPDREWFEDLIYDWDLEDIKTARGNFT